MTPISLLLGNDLAYGVSESMSFGLFFDKYKHPNLIAVVGEVIWNEGSVLYYLSTDNH